jgi:hypothetical protein
MGDPALRGRRRACVTADDDGPQVREIVGVDGVEHARGEEGMGDAFAAEQVGEVVGAVDVGGRDDGRGARVGRHQQFEYGGVEAR